MAVRKPDIRRTAKSRISVSRTAKNLLNRRTQRSLYGRKRRRRLGRRGRRFTKSKSRNKRYKRR